MSCSVLSHSLLPHGLQHSSMMESLSIVDSQSLLKLMSIELVMPNAFLLMGHKMATHSSVLAWRIPRTGEPGGLPSLGSHRVGHDWNDLAAAAAACCLLIPELLYPFICWWAFRLLPCPSCNKQWCNEHWSTCIFFSFDFLILILLYHHLKTL